VVAAAATVECRHNVAEMAVACYLHLQQFAARCRDSEALRQELLRPTVARRVFPQSLLVGHKLGIVACVLGKSLELRMIQPILKDL